MPREVGDIPEEAPGRAGGGRDRSRGPLVAIVVPTYNEAGNLPELARRIFALDIPGSMLIVVDDGSPDGTGSVVEDKQQQYGQRVLLIQRGRKLGLGTAYVEGFGFALELGAEYIVQMDADLSHAPEYLPGFLEDLKDADVVVGSRYVSGGKVDQSWGLSRRALSYGGSLGIRLISGLSLNDATSGFKAFRGVALDSVDLTQLRCTGFAFQPELAHACQRLGLKTVEHPIEFSGRARGRSKMSAAIVMEAIWRLPALRLKRR